MKHCNKICIEYKQKVNAEFRGDIEELGVVKSPTSNAEEEDVNVGLSDAEEGE